MKKHALSEREKLLLPIAFLVIFFALYAVLRVKPAMARIKELKRELAAAIQKQEGIVFPKQTAGDAQQLAAKLTALKSETQALAVSLEALKGELVSAGSGTEIQELKVEISSLAQRCDVRVTENVPVEDAAGTDRRRAGAMDPSGEVPWPVTRDTAPFIHESLIQELSRPLYRLSTESSFVGLIHFLGGLGHSSRKVTVVSFDVRAAGKLDLMGQPVLDSQLILAF